MALMKLPNKILSITLLMIITSLATPNITKSSPTPNVNVQDETKSMYIKGSRMQESFTIQGRYLASQRTCNRYPTVCRAKGSAGPDCCGKQCVDTDTDKRNCGKCGNKCKYSEMCCQGKCVNPSKDENNCGKCSKRCEKGSSCLYGMCSYA